MPRTYKRKFDWDEAARRHAAGESASEIAASLGVSANAVYYALNSQSRARALDYARTWQRGGTCSRCGASCTRGYTRCRSCLADDKRTNVRPSELRCPSCKAWKLDEAFPHNRAEAQRRGRHGLCRACCTDARREYRRTHPDVEREAVRRQRARRREMSAA